MKPTSALTITQPTAIEVASPDFKDLSELMLQTVAPSSARVYSVTVNKWLRWCEAANRNPLDFTPRAVLDFLKSEDTTKATRQRQLSAIRKLAQMAFILAPDNETYRRRVEALKVIKAPQPDQTTRDKQERVQRALTPAEADKLLRVWNEDTDKAKRNAALVALLLLSGIRRSEAAALRWQDIDFENGVLNVRHGKGDKQRDVPIAGEFALEALRQWQMAQPLGREYVFCAVERGGGIGKQDSPITGTDVYRIWGATGQRAGIADIKPHDARRTFITEGLATGTPLQTMQSAAGHARGDTTLGYAQAVNARQARKELKFRYG